MLEVYGTGGAVFMRGGEVWQNIGDSPEEADDFPPSPESPLTQFVGCCLDGTAAPAGLGLEDGLVMTRIVEAAYKAEADGCTVAL